MTPMEMVREFHEKFEHPIDVPVTKDLIALRMSLIEEEGLEVSQEMLDKYDSPVSPESINKKKLTKELADLLYVTYGTAVTFGLPLEEVFEEVHRSNMSKLTVDGKVLRREDGKVLKSDQYKEPDLERFFK